ncbi:MAG: DNA polymerase III subunit beta, partial [Acidiferrobacterales bacterium]
QTLPILSNVLMRVEDSKLWLTGTDLEIELVATVGLDKDAEGAMTVPARKLYDICRALPAEAMLDVRQDGNKAVVRSGSSRFTLMTLPVEDFPTVEAGQWDLEVGVAQHELKRLVDRTHFCMAQQDVRYYLNGLLLEFAGRRLRAVATDGHRMGLSELEFDGASDSDRQVIVPRKGVLEVARFLGTVEGAAQVALSSNHVRVAVEDVTMTSKLIDGRFPDYQQVLPASCRWAIRADRAALRQALGRAAILANEKYRGVRLTIRPNTLVVTAHNPEQEEAQEELAINYDGDELEIGFNVNYVIEALGGLESSEVELGINDAHSSCVLQTPDQQHTRYVIMPMRL